MHTLFARIFGWLWLTLLLVAAGSVVALVLLRSTDRHEQVRWGRLTDALLAPQGREAVLIYERDGAEALRAALEAWRGDYYLFGPQGVEATGRAAPEPVVRIAHETGRVRAPRAGRMAPGSSAPCLATPIQSQSGGEPYVFVGVLPPRLPPGPPPPWMALWSAWDAVLLVMGVAFLISGLLSFALSRQIAGPVRSLQAATRRVSGGDLSARASSSLGARRDELGALARDFDAMTARLAHLLASHRQLLRDVSHELRSPLARLGVALDLARRQTGPEAAELLDRIEGESGRLNDLIGQVLELARLDGGAETPPPAALDLAEVVRDVAADAAFEAQADDRRVQVSADVSCPLRGSTPLLRSAIENVVRNALRHSPAGATVEISLAQTSMGGRDAARVAVRDHGPGVPAESLADIFRPFHRLAQPGGPRTAGAGLGLAIAQRVVDLHGGVIAARNADGGGLRVELVLPLSSSAMPGGSASANPPAGGDANVNQAPPGAV